jgi:hypothetical protein
MQKVPLIFLISIMISRRSMIAIKGQKDKLQFALKILWAYRYTLISKRRWLTRFASIYMSSLISSLERSVRRHPPRNFNILCKTGFSLDME